MKRLGSNGFGLLVVLVVFLVIAVLGGAGWVIYSKHHQYKTSVTSQTSSVTVKASSQQYLDVKEWGIRLPLTSSIADAYYVVSTGSQDSNGQPNTIWLGLKSLDSGGCAAAQANTGGPSSIAALLRVRPTDTDPVSGTLYTKLDPNGTTIDGYYYAYQSGIQGKTCASQAQLNVINAAFKVAASKAIALPEDLSVHTLKGTQLPQDMLQGMGAIWDAKVPGWRSAPASAGCIGPGNANYTVKEVNDMYAVAGLYCDSGSATLFVKVNGVWQIAQSTQFEFSCDVIAKYNVPRDLVAASYPDGAVCVDTNGKSQPIQ